MTSEMMRVIYGIVFLGMQTYIAYDLWKGAIKLSRLINRGRHEEARSIRSLVQTRNGTLVKLNAALADAEAFVSPIQLLPCAWWKWEAYLTYVKNSGRNVSGGERQVAEVSSGNAWVYAEQEGFILPIRLADAQVFPTCTFSGSVNELTSENTNVMHFVEKILKPHLSKNSEIYAETHRSLASGVESPLSLRICEYVLPLEDPHYIIGNIRAFPPATDTPAAAAIERLSRFGNVLPKCIFSKKTLIGSSGEERTMDALKKQWLFQVGMAVFAGLIALAVLIGCVMTLV